MESAIYRSGIGQSMVKEGGGIYGPQPPMKPVRRRPQTS
jgi:hypothetical protein